MTLRSHQIEALRYLYRHGARPGSDYWMPLWAMEPPHCSETTPLGVDGRTFSSLVRRGYCDVITAHDGRSAFQLTPAGVVQGGPYSEAERKT